MPVSAQPTVTVHGVTGASPPSLDRCAVASVITGAAGLLLPIAMPVVWLLGTTGVLGDSSWIYGFVIWAIYLDVGPFMPLAAVVTGHLAVYRIRRAGRRGSHAAVTGLLLGYAGLVLAILAQVRYVTDVGPILS